MTNEAKLRLTTPTEREIEITRVFDAPRDRVFDALTKPSLLEKWFHGPPGWTLAVCRIDLAEGGTYRYVWRHDDGREMGVSGVYREVERPRHLVHTESFDQPWYPGEAVITTNLTEEGGRTKLSATVRYESKEARDTVLQTPMEEGLAAGYDRLEEVLAAEKERDS